MWHPGGYFWPRGNYKIYLAKTLDTQPLNFPYPYDNYMILVDEVIVHTKRWGGFPNWS